MSFLIIIRVKSLPKNFHYQPIVMEALQIPLEHPKTMLMS